MALSKDVTPAEFIEIFGTSDLAFTYRKAGKVGNLHGLEFGHCHIAPDHRIDKMLVITKAPDRESCRSILSKEELPLYQLLMQTKAVICNGVSTIMT